MVDSSLGNAGEKASIILFEWNNERSYRFISYLTARHQKLRPIQFVPDKLTRIFELAVWTMRFESVTVTVHSKNFLMLQQVFLGFSFVR